MIDILDHHLDHHQDDEDVVVVENIVIVVDIHHHHPVHVLPLQVHRLIVHVHLPVVHIEDIDVDDQVRRLIDFRFERIVRCLFRFITIIITIIVQFQ